MSENVSEIPSIELFKLTDGGLKKFNIKEYIGDRKVAVFAIPGAFTPTCSDNHFSGYLQNADALKAKGIEEVICLASNDAFVCKAFSDKFDPDGKITIFADGNNLFAEAMELSCDLSAMGLGTRTMRYAMLVEGGRVKSLLNDGGPQLEKSAAEKLLASL